MQEGRHWPESQLRQEGPKLLIGSRATREFAPDLEFAGLMARAACAFAHRQRQTIPGCAIPGNHCRDLERRTETIFRNSLAPRPGGRCFCHKATILGSGLVDWSERYPGKSSR